MNELNKCPCCGRHCDMTDLHCNRGEEYSKTGVIPEKHRGGRCREESRCIDRRLQWIMREVAHKFRYMSEPKGGKKRVLSIIYHEKEIAQNKLTEMVGIAPGTMSEILNKLETAEFICRHPNESDKRTFLLRITEKGEEQARADFAERNTCAADMFSSLNEEEKETLMHLLTRLDDKWQKALSGNEEYGNYHHGHERKHHHHGDGRHEARHSERKESKT